ncbi:hypothetical protein J6590_085869 [Homalodisca vitripennis]|nr:hypothetical protein J6590_085869 [Homalodisca vitripennis]
MIVGGSNSINTEEEDKIELLLNTLLTKISDITNVVLTTIPHRYDQPYLNSTIHEINKKIYKTAAHHKTPFLPINNLITRDHFTRRGLHFNKQGKDILCTSISLHATIRLHSKRTTKTSCIPPNKKYDGEKSISVVETNMKNSVQDFRGDESVAFAHTISSDLGNKRNMPAGVAVVFREEFGRAQRSDCINLWRGKRVQSYNKVGVQWEANGLRLQPGILTSNEGLQRKGFEEAGLLCHGVRGYWRYREHHILHPNIQQDHSGLSHSSFVKILNNLIAFQHVQNTSPVSSLVPSSNPSISLASSNSSHTHILTPTVLPSHHPLQSTQTNQTPDVDTNRSCSLFFYTENLCLFPPL